MRPRSYIYRQYLYQRYESQLLEATVMLLFPSPFKVYC